MSGGREQGKLPTVAELEQFLTEERHRREPVEQRARSLADQLAAREEHVIDLRRAMLALTAGPVSEREQPTVPAQSDGHGHPAEQPVSEGGRPGRRRHCPRRVRRTIRHGPARDPPERHRPADPRQTRERRRPGALRHRHRRQP
ncbi:hypothetical protein ACF1GS_18620 [Streptomyces eurythermus]|uniref:hypothetical protein n=1 Tax=Streptomyces eurythermus TaxID=42237 RepID=UPI0036F50515